MGGFMEFVSEVRTWLTGEKNIRFQSNANGALKVSIQENVTPTSAFTTDSFNNTPVELTAATTAQDVKAAVTSKSIYVTDISISTDTAMWIKIHDDTGTPVQMIAKKYLPANSVWTKQFKTPLKFASGKKVQVTCSLSSGNISIDLGGYAI